MVVPGRGDWPSASLHLTYTCEGAAAFEYAFNVENEVCQAEVRDLADIVY